MDLHNLHTQICLETDEAKLREKCFTFFHAYFTEIGDFDKELFSLSKPYFIVDGKVLHIKKLWYSDKDIQAQIEETNRLCSVDGLKTNTITEIVEALYNEYLSDYPIF